MEKFFKNFRVPRNKVYTLAVNNMYKTINYIKTFHFRGKKAIVTTPIRYYDFCQFSWAKTKIQTKRMVKFRSCFLKYVNIEANLLFTSS